MAVAFTASPSLALADDCPNADTLPGAAAPADVAAATLCLLNQQRAAAGLEALATDTVLTRTADGYAAEMVRTHNFAHTDTRGGNVGSRVFATAGTLDAWTLLGENLGWGSLDQATPRSIVTGWMNSPTHRDNVLDASFDKIGVGIIDAAPVDDRDNARTYVTAFGDSAPQRTATSAKPSQTRRCALARKRARKSGTRRARAKAARVCRAAKARR